MDASSTTTPQTKELIIQLREELREVNDLETLQLLEKYERNERSHSIDFSEFRKKYSI